MSSTAPKRKGPVKASARPSKKQKSSSTRPQQPSAAASGSDTWIRCPTDQWDGTQLAGPVPREAAAKEWPQRRQATFKPVEIPSEDTDTPAAATGHFRQLRLQKQQASDSEEEEEETDEWFEAGSKASVGVKRYWYLRVLEIFIDEDVRHACTGYLKHFGRRWVSGTWLVTAHDTHLSCSYKKEKGSAQQITTRLAVGVEDRQLFQLSREDSEAGGNVIGTGAILGVVEVAEVAPQGQVPGDGALYTQGTYDTQFVTFADSPSHVPGSKAKWAGKQRVLHCLDLYSGCGGTSHVHVDTAEVVIKAGWAVDCCPAMTDSFRVNHPDAEVWTMGVDSFLWLLKLWDRLCKEYSKQPRPLSNNQASGKRVQAILAVTVKEKGCKGISGQQKNELMQALTEDDCSLEYQCQLKDGMVCWMTEADLKAQCAQKKVYEFVQRMNDRRALPRPGDDLVVMGGPPCQGVSGLNRHASRADILDDVKNRQVTVFYDIINFLQPAFVLMEQVADTWKKQGGVYTRYASGRLLTMGYQTRQGFIAAGDHGVPQGRWRCFTWGAKTGEEQLPPFPQPIHQFAGQGPLPSAGKLCQVTFPSLEAWDRAHPMVVLGDVLSDLPPVSTFCQAEGANYLGDPRSITQAWLRRDPPAGQPAAAERAVAADAIMAPEARALGQALEEHLTKHRAKDGAARETQVGALYRCSKQGLSKEEATERLHDRGTVRAILEGSDPASAMPQEDREVLRLYLEASMIASDQNVGSQVLEEAAKALEVARKPPTAFPLRDHRPLVLNQLDYQRVAAMERREGFSMRDARGVVVHPNKQLCSGDTHARPQVRADGTEVCVCPNTNNRRPKAAANAQKKLPAKAAGRQGAEKKGAGRGAAGKENGGTSGTQLVPHGSCPQDQEADAQAAPRESGVQWYCASVPGCAAYTVILACGGVLVPYYAITYKGGLASGRHAPFGRISRGHILSTIVGRAEPHNLAILHPEQDRVMTIRENARCQGFPDYHVLVGRTRASKTGCLVRNSSLTDRYTQVGNAVCPQVAAALGRCLAQAAVGAVPAGCAVLHVPDPAYEECMAGARRDLGLRFWAEQEGHGVASGHGNGWYPKHYAAPLARAREGLRESLHRTRKQAVAEREAEDEQEDEGEGIEDYEV